MDGMLEGINMARTRAKETLGPTVFEKVYDLLKTLSHVAGSGAEEADYERDLIMQELDTTLGSVAVTGGCEDVQLEGVFQVKILVALESKYQDVGSGKIER